MASNFSRAFFFNFLIFFKLLIYFVPKAKHDLRSQFRCSRNNNAYFTAGFASEEFVQVVSVIELDVKVFFSMFAFAVARKEKIQFW